jgi:murein DD-endopeptidase MepM/ murein hydrolase activator NlpD
MKKWTVMLIPHDRGERRTFELHTWQIAAAVALVAAGTVGVTMYLQNRPIAHGAVATKPEPAALPTYAEEHPPPPELAPVAAPPKSALQAEIEARVRAEYEARDEAIASELNRLYVFEAEVREAMGMPPREEAVALEIAPGGGQGGGRPEAPEFDLGTISAEYAPPNLIHGVERPSADLMLHEMRIRMASMQNLLSGMEVQQDRLARVPSIPPTNESKRTISSGFGNRRDPFTQRVRFHGGIDIATVYGAPIQATARGVVTESDRDPYYGHFVKIDHGNGYETLFGHMSKRVATPGQEVERGDVIGRVGSTGRSTSPHIHYEVFKDGVRVNPRKYIGQ